MFYEATILKQDKIGRKSDIWFSGTESKLSPKKLLESDKFDISYQQVVWIIQEMMMIHLVHFFI